MHHRLVLYLAGIAAIAVLVLALHASASPGLGSTIVWSTPAAASTPAGASSGAIPTAPPPSPSASGDPFSGLQGPISGLFSRLNSGTRQSAAGQYSILQAIGGTLRSWIEGLLSAATGHS